MTTPEVLSAISLNGTALRRAAERARIDEAVQELRELAGGRNDLLAQEGGSSRERGSPRQRPTSATS